MKKLTIGQHLHASSAVLILFLLIGIGLAIGVEKTRSATLHQSDQRAAAGERIRHGLLRVNDALRGLLLNPKNESDTARITAADKELAADFERAQPLLSENTELFESFRALRSFTSKTIVTPRSKLISLLETDPTEAANHHRNTWLPLIQQQQEPLIDALRQQIQRANRADLEKSQTMTWPRRAAGRVGEWLGFLRGWVGIGCLLVILLLGMAVAHFRYAALRGPLGQLVGALERLRNGDFTQPIDTSRPAWRGASGRDSLGIIRLLAEGLNGLADDLSGLVLAVEDSGHRVTLTASEIAATAKAQQTTAHSIAATTAEIGATAKGISATTQELARTMGLVNAVVTETLALAGSGQEALARATKTAGEQVREWESGTGTLGVVNEKTSHLSAVVTTLTKVADQTNLLSLNAAIEAEKAGEYGLGFAVVAMEIRRLADQTAVATFDLEKMAKNIQEAVSAGVMGRDKFSEEVREGFRVIRQVSAQLEQIIHQVQSLPPRFQTVCEGINYHSTGAQQISETLTQLSEAAQQTAESLRESTLAHSQLTLAARGLQNGVARFKLKITN